MLDTEIKEMLWNSILGELRAYLTYKKSAEIAKSEGYTNIAKLFLATAEAEMIHLRRFYLLYTQKQLDEKTYLEIVNC